MIKRLPLKKLFIVLMMVSLSIVVLTSADDINNDVNTQIETTSLETTPVAVEEAKEEPKEVAPVQYVERRRLLDLAIFSDIPVAGIKERAPGSHIMKISALGFFLVDTWSQLEINHSKGMMYNVGVFGVSASLDIFPTRNFWFIGVEYNYLRTAYETNLHIVLAEGGYMFRPAKNFYITPTLGAGIIMGSRSYETGLPPVGWSMSFGFGLAYEFYRGITIELEPKMFFGSDKHNAFSFVPLTLGLSYAY